MCLVDGTQTTHSSSIDMPNLARAIEMMAIALQQQSATLKQQHQTTLHQLQTTRLVA